MHVKKIETTKMDPKPNFYMLSKEDFASVCFLQTKVPLVPSCPAADFLKSCLPGARLIKPNC
jgi:hypothetical protein